MAKIPCPTSLLVSTDLSPCLSQSMFEAAALYSPPSHGRLTPPPKG
ncbi:MAG TPA: hypothetical protein VHB99_01410 [Pirellulales bacterium]|nr:hypothetical protein [Pirellulales bacterium]